MDSPCVNKYPRWFETLAAGKTVKSGSVSILAIMYLPANYPPMPNELPSDYADRLGMIYASGVSAEHKKSRGQFFTPTPIARLMASYSTSRGASVSILDPGCGTAILTSALAEHLAKNKSLRELHLTAYETDVNLISFSERSLAYLKQWLSDRGIVLSYILCVDDFVLQHSKKNSESGLFDIIISNPPYFKLTKDDERAQAAKNVASGQSNIYSAFMAIAAQQLRNRGEIIFITPRSFASGNYFKSFREYFFSTVDIENIHLFVSRKDTFGRDSVLQETVIMKGRKCKGNAHKHKIALSSSHGVKDIEKPSIKIYEASELIDFNTKEKMLHLPTTAEEERVIRLFKSWDGSLQKYNIQVSTGPVVAFRSQQFIYEKYRNGTVTLAPLIWLHNVNKMMLEWPLEKPAKGQYINITAGSKTLLLPNKDYIFLRRFSTKDDKSRLIAAPYFSRTTKAAFIGVENKVNYIYRPDGKLEKEEIVGLCALLNSNLFDTYFRTFNGNVNVSATELREISLPPHEQIKYIGKTIIDTNDFSTTYINELINEIFELNHITYE